MIIALEKEAFIAAAWEVVGRKVSKQRLLSDIYEAARASIGLPVEPSSDAVVFVGRPVHGTARCSSSLRMVLAEGSSLSRHWSERQ